MKNPVRHASVLVVLVAAFALCLPAAHAATNYWTNSAGGNYTNSANWNTAAPVIADQAFFTNANVAYAVTADSSVTNANLAFSGNGAIVALDATGNTIWTTNQLSVNSSRLGVESTLVLVGGTLNATNPAAAGPLLLGDTTRGTVIVSNGFLNVGGALVGNAGGAQGTLNILGGTNNLIVRPSGYVFALGQATSSTGIFLLAGSSYQGAVIYATNNTTRVGGGGVGFFTVSNGTYFGKDLTLGNTGGGVGTVNLFGGSNIFSGNVSVGGSGGTGTGTVLMAGNSPVLTSATLTLGGAANSLGTMTISNGTLISSGALTLGANAAGTRGVLNFYSGQVSAANVILGANAASSNNSLLVSGRGTYLSNGALTVGSVGSFNQMIVSNGAVVTSSGGGTLGTSAGSYSNSVLVTGSGTVWSNTSGVFSVGNGGGSNTLTIANSGAVYSAGGAYVGVNSSYNSALVTDTGSLWQVTSLNFSKTGNSLLIANGGTMIGTTNTMGGVSNTLVVAGPGSSYTGSGYMYIGATSGSDVGNALYVTNGGRATFTHYLLYGTNNLISLSGGGTLVSNLALANLYVGASTAAFKNRVRILDGATNVVTGSFPILVGGGTGATSNVLEVAGTGSLLSSANAVNVGYGILSAGNQLLVTNGGQVVAAGVNIGGASSSSNSVGNAIYVLSGSKVVSSAQSIMGQGAGANSNVLVVAGGSTWSNVATFLTIGMAGSYNQMFLTNSGFAYAGGGFKVGDTAAGSNNTVLVDNSVLSVPSTLQIGVNGKGNQLVLTNGGQILSTGAATIGSAAAANSNSVLVGGGSANSTWNLGGSATLTVGVAGSQGNALNILSGGVVTNAFSLKVQGTNGQINLASGGRLSATVDNNGQVSGFGNTVLVSNSNSKLTLNAFFLGDNGASNRWIIADGGEIANTAGTLTLGRSSNAVGNSIQIYGPNARLTWANNININDRSAGTAQSNSIVVANAGSLAITSANDLVVGLYGAGASLLVTNGGSASVGNNLYLGKSSNAASGYLLVDGPGSLVSAAALVVGSNIAGINMPNFNQATFGNGLAIIQNGGVLALGGASSGIYGGAGGFGAVSNLGGVFQFGINDPRITNYGLANMVVKDGTVAFKNVGGAVVNGNIANLTYLGTNTLRLDSATNSTLAYYQIGGAGQPFSILDLAGTNSLWNTGTLNLAAGGEIRASNVVGAAIAALVTNAGTVRVLNSVLTFQSNVVLNGGTFLTQNGTNQFAKGLTLANNSTLTFTSGISRIAGAVSNSLGSTIQAINSIVTWQDAVVIGGHYFSDPSTNIFTTNVTVTASGSLYGSNGDLFVFQKDFFMQSTNRGQFSLSQAAVIFSNGPNHLLSISNSGALELGHFTNFAMVSSNFSIGTLSIAPGDRVTLAGSRDGGVTNALYVGWLDIQGWSTNGADRAAEFLSASNSIVSALQLTGINLYYDFYDTRNGWLNEFVPELGYELWGAGNGLLLPIPEPSPFLALGAGLGLLAFLRRHKTA